MVASCAPNQQGISDLFLPLEHESRIKKTEYDFVEADEVGRPFANDSGHEFKVQVLFHQPQLRCCCFFRDVISDSIVTWKNRLYEVTQKLKEL